MHDNFKHLATTDNDRRFPAPGTLNPEPSPRQRGQVLIIALIILGLLLILGFVFLGIVDRNVHGGAVSQTRSAASDLSEAGIRYAQAQLVSGPLGADWRGTPVDLTQGGTTNTTLDPDAYYMRPRPAPIGGPVIFPGTAREDLGGPDGLGPFVRVTFDRGRALVRVRYAPSDANAFQITPTGALRTPGAVHSQILIESIGRTGVININDPTTLAQGTPVLIQNFGSLAAYQAALANLTQFNTKFIDGRYLFGVATIGLTNYARFITNMYNVNRPADIGIPSPVVGNGSAQLSTNPGLGVLYGGANAGTTDLDVGQLGVYQLGTLAPVASPATNMMPVFGGSMFSNADVTFHGTDVLNLNGTLGDKLLVDGNISADDNSALTVNQTFYNANTNAWQTTTNTLPAVQFTSRSNQYTTLNGALLDGVAETDVAGYSRGIGRLVPPSMLTLDPQSHESRYLEATRESGIVVNGTNTGEFGHGRGVYVSNGYDTQIPAGESGRAGTGAEESLVHDWLNPASGDPTSGWVGPFYVAPGAFVQLLTDGFTIQLDQGQTWTTPAGANSGQSTLRFRIGLNNGQLYIVDGLEDPAGINGNAPNFAAGQPFDGVLYFDGNVRVRGFIPTDVQLTIVSDASIYIEGAITKGAMGNNVTGNYGTPLARPSKSAAMLMAKDYVCVNTTMFTGPTAGQAVQAVNDQQNNTGFNAARIMADGSTADGQLQLVTDLLTDPLTGTATNPSTWTPYALGYKDAVSGVAIPTSLLMTHAMDDGTAAATFIGLNINFGVPNAGPPDPSVYFFPGSPSPSAGAGAPPQVEGYFAGLNNTASDYLYASNNPLYWENVDMYGLGRDAWQRYPKYESRGFQFIWPAAVNGQTSVYNPATQLITLNGGSANGPNSEAYSLFAPGANNLLARPAHISGVSSNNYLLAHANVAPGDVRIEASLYAEEGSFFVIPGPWFNPNANDTRDAYNADVAASGRALADQHRVDNYGNGPEVPFFGEPLDIRIQIVGSVSENMPPPLAAQTAWMQKWGWIPGLLGADDGQAAPNPRHLPISHVPGESVNYFTNLGLTADTGVAPNILIEYDPVLATGRTDGFNPSNDPAGLVRVDSFGRALPPMPRLPVSPALTYFGENQ